MNEQKSIGVGLIGCGTVGAGVVRLLVEKADLYAQRLGRSLELRRVLVRDSSKLGRPKYVNPALLTGDERSFLSTPDMPIIVEAAGGVSPIDRTVRAALEAGKHVVTANKSLLAAEGGELFALARRHNVSIAFEASCGGGIPIVTALQFGLSANRIEAFFGILNGTCNYILTEMTQHGKTYVESLREAQQGGLAEANPALDVSGQDTAEKLAILSSLAFGKRINPTHVTCEGIEGLDLDDIRFGAELGYEVKLLAIAERSEASATDLNPHKNAVGISLRVQPCFVHADLPLAQVHGAFNALAIYGHAVGYTMYVGRGAGQMPTASAVVADLLNVASGWYPKAFATLNLWPDQQRLPTVISSNGLISRFYIRISVRDVPGVVARVSKILGDAGISLSALLQHEVAAGQFVPVVIITHTARQGAVIKAMRDIEQLDDIGGGPVCFCIVDMPKG